MDSFYTDAVPCTQNVNTKVCRHYVIHDFADTYFCTLVHNNHGPKMLYIVQFVR